MPARLRAFDVLEGVARTREAHAWCRITAVEGEGDLVGAEEVWSASPPLAESVRRRVSGKLRRRAQRQPRGVGLGRRIPSVSASGIAVIGRQNC